jgi:hypothetical protein
MTTKVLQGTNLTDALKAQGLWRGAGRPSSYFRG